MTFEDWYFKNGKCDKRVFENDNQYYSAKEAWDFQQKKIDKLTKMLDQVNKQTTENY